ncbi:MAG: TRIC cation channel family protein [Oscillospiraceae bacterium]|nr:TRIC cation channel family protein [Oscillospiraceae bacterium]
METLVFILEIIGTIAFAASGAMVGINKKMDIFGVCILGLTVSIGGGVIRDLILGNTPPNTFKNPVYAVVAIVVSIIVFIPQVRSLLKRTQKIYDMTMLIMDSVGLGVFTVVGVQVAYSVPYDTGYFLAIFVGVLTGVGGGILRDLFADDVPYIFVKHIYACASLAGAVLCALLWNVIGQAAAMIVGSVTVMALRFLAAHFRWSLPKA